MSKKHLKMTKRRILAIGIVVVITVVCSLILMYFHTPTQPTGTFTTISGTLELKSHPMFDENSPTVMVWTINAGGANYYLTDDGVCVASLIGGLKENDAVTVEGIVYSRTDIHINLYWMLEYFTIELV